MDWAHKNIVAPTHLVVGGSSGGSLGAQFWVDKIFSRFLWNEREERMAIDVMAFFGDSYFE